MRAICKLWGTLARERKNYDVKNENIMEKILNVHLLTNGWREWGDFNRDCWEFTSKERRRTEIEKNGNEKKDKQKLEKKIENTFYM